VTPVPDWTTFDGARWGELTLGETTLGGFGQRFSCRDTDTPGLLLATTRSRSNTRAYVVFSGADPAARLEWITLFFEGGKPLASEALLQQFNTEPVERYPETRALDWRFWLFPRRGIAAVIGRDQMPERVAGLIFGSPERLAQLAERLPTQETPVAAPDEKEQPPLVARLGRVNVSASREGEINFDRDRLENTVEYQVQSALERRGAILFDRGAEGRASVTVRVRRRSDKENQRRVAIDVSSSITAQGPYGQVTGYGSASREIEGDVTSGRIRSHAADAAEDATLQAVASARRSMEKQRADAREARTRGQMLEMAKRLLRLGRLER